MQHTELDEYNKLGIIERPMQGVFLKLVLLLTMHYALLMYL